MRKNRSRFVFIGAVLAIGVVSTVGVAWATHPTSAIARLIDTNGRSSGTVTFQPVDGKMSISVDVRLPREFAGFHGFHMHRVGKCDPAAIDPANGQRVPFFTSEGHLGSEDGHNHGLHDGDMSPLLVNRDGSARMTLLTDHVSFDRLFDADGTAVLIHLGRDNLGNIPARYAPNGPDAATLNTGDAGPRTVCGVVARR